jgi:hypothetical protein
MNGMRDVLVMTLLLLPVSCADANGRGDADGDMERGAEEPVDGTGEDGDAPDRADDGGDGDPADDPDGDDPGQEDASDTADGDEWPIPEEFTLPGGAYADIAVWNDEVWIFAETEARTGVYLYRNFELVETVPASWPYVLYVRGCGWPGGGAAAFQAGDYPAAHWGGVTHSWTEDGTVFGIEVADIEWTGTGFVVAYTVPGRVIVRWVQEDGTTTRREEMPTPTTQGIHRVLADGTVELVDDVRTDPAFPLLYRPWVVDGRLAVGECTDDPPRALGYHDGAPFVLFDGLAYRPRAVAVPGGYAALCVGETGPRVVGLPPYDFL